MFENVVYKEGNKFYSVAEEAVIKAEKKLNITFPVELLEFYEKVGYGFLDSKTGNFNRIMDPDSLCEFRFREGQFENNLELEIYKEDEIDKLIFFEVCEDVYLSMGFGKDNNGKIFYGEKMIADSLEEFLVKYQEDEQYYI